VLAQVKPEDVRAYLDAASARPGGLAPIAVELAPGHAGVTVKEWEPTHASVRPARTR
jgi:hypothetical protein